MLPLAPDLHLAVTGFNDIYNAWAGLYPHSNRDYYEYGDRLGVGGPDIAIPYPPAVADYPLRVLHLIALSYYRMTVTEEVVRRAVDRRTLSPEAAVESSLRNADLLAHWAERYGYLFIYALQPNIYLTDKVLTAGEQVIADADAQFGNYHRNGYNLLKQGLAASQINYLDLDLAIAAERLELFIDNVHFGDRGYQLIGSHLAEYLLSILDCEEMQTKTLGRSQPTVLHD